MNCEDEPIHRIREAGALAAKAEERWNAGNLAAVEECVATLEVSANELRAVLTAAIGDADSLRGSRDEILLLKERVNRLERLSDLAAAFLRGGSGPGSSQGYRAGGFEDTCPSLVATTRIQA